MKIYVCDSYEAMSRAAADMVAAQLLLKPDSHMGLTAGKTPVGMFAELVRIYQEGRVSFSEARFYNLEEYVGCGPTDDNSCYQYLQHHLISKVNAQKESLLLPDGLSKDIDHECAAYDTLLGGLPGGGLDMQILGIGADGHIGCNRPQEVLHAESHHVCLPSGRQVAAMGIRSIMLARHLLLIANGADKAQAVADMCSGAIKTSVPATLLQLHPNVTVILDKEAASQLR